MKQVVFIATPHRGSFRVTTLVRNLVQRLVTLPGNVVEGIAEAAQSNPEAISLKALGGFRRPSTTCAPAIPSSGPWRQAARPRGHRPFHYRGGGGPHHVRQRWGGHVRERPPEGVASEKVVRSSHSTQSEPDTIQEVRRILREHVLGTAEKPGTPVAHSR